MDLCNGDVESNVVSTARCIASPEVERVVAMHNAGRWYTGGARREPSLRSNARASQEFYDAVGHHTLRGKLDHVLQFDLQWSRSRELASKYGSSGAVTRWLNESITIDTLIEILHFLSFCYRDRAKAGQCSVPEGATRDSLLKEAVALNIGFDGCLLHSMTKLELVEAIAYDRNLRNRHPLYHVVPLCHGVECSSTSSIMAKALLRTSTTPLRIPAAVKREAQGPGRGKNPVEKDVAGAATVKINRMFEEFARVLFEKEAASEQPLLQRQGKYWVVPVESLHKLFA